MTFEMEIMTIEQGVMIMNNLVRSIIGAYYDKVLCRFARDNSIAAQGCVFEKSYMH